MVFGWDVSTSFIGATVLNDKGEFVASSYLKLKDLDNIFEKCQLARDFVTDFTLQHSHGPTTDVHYVEERLGNFAFGRSMMQTLMLLGAFNLVVSWFLWEVGKNVVHIHPTTVKAIMKRLGLKIEKGEDKKQKTLAFVLSKDRSFPVEHNRNGKPQPWCYDMADAYIVAKAGFLKFGCNGKQKSED